jgi:hypothetical protein
MITKKCFHASLNNCERLNNMCGNSVARKILTAEKNAEEIHAEVAEALQSSFSGSQRAFILSDPPR